MIRTWEEDGVIYAVGMGKVILRKGQKAPLYKGEGRKAVTNFSAEVDRHKTGRKNERGFEVYETKILSFVAFGDLARYCRNFENQDKFVFCGTLEVDDYWTERNNTGEVVYKVKLDFCMAQPQEGQNAEGYGVGYPGDLPDGFDDLPDY